MRENKATESSKINVEQPEVERYKELKISMSLEDHQLLIKKAWECQCTPEALVVSQISKLIQSKSQS
jgi:hypothetical protein